MRVRVSTCRAYTWFVMFVLAPTSSTNPEEEDIDIVGNEDAQHSRNSGSESSRDLQLHVYGPPQFTEADVLACLSQYRSDPEEGSPTGLNKEETEVKREVTSPGGADSPSSSPPNDLRPDADTEHDRRVVSPLKIKVEDRSKCSKCLVSMSWLSLLNSWFEDAVFL